MSANDDPLTRLKPILIENGIDAFDYFRLYLKDEVPPVIVFNDDLYITRSDLHFWKSKLRLASFDNKSKALKARVA